MEREFTLREKQLTKAVRRRVHGDYRFDVLEQDLCFVLGDSTFSLSRDHVTEASDLGRVADMVAHALTSNHAQSSGWRGLAVH